MSDARLENDGIIGENFLLKVETRIVQASENNRKLMGCAELVTVLLYEILWKLTGLCRVQFITKKYKSCVYNMLAELSRFPECEMAETRYGKAKGKVIPRH